MSNFIPLTDEERAANIIDVAGFDLKTFIKCPKCGAANTIDKWDADYYEVCGDGCCHAPAICCDDCATTVWVYPHDKVEGEFSFPELLTSDSITGPFETPERTR
jgi:hypothetical protein